MPCGLAHDVEDGIAGVCDLSTSCSDVGFACGLFCKGRASPLANGFIGLVEPPTWDTEWRPGRAVLDVVHAEELEREVSLVDSFPEKSRLGLSVLD